VDMSAIPAVTAKLPVGRESPIDLADRGRHRKDRQIHGHHDESDRRTQEHHHHGLQQRREISDCLIDFIFIKVGDLSEHGVQRAGRLSD